MYVGWPAATTRSPQTLSKRCQLDAKSSVRGLGTKFLQRVGTAATTGAPHALDLILRQISPILSVRPHLRCTLVTHVRSLHYINQLVRLSFACVFVSSLLHETAVRDDVHTTTLFLTQVLGCQKHHLASLFRTALRTPSLSGYAGALP